MGDWIRIFGIAVLIVAAVVVAGVVDYHFSASIQNRYNHESEIGLRPNAYDSQRAFNERQK